MEQEEWRPVVGWEQYYEVSNLGRVRRIQTGHILKPGRVREYTGYCVYFEVQKRYASPMVARLVAESFIGPPPRAGMRVYHKDLDVTNNRCDNLVWSDFNPHFTKEAMAKSAEIRRTPEWRAEASVRNKERLKDPSQYAKLVNSVKALKKRQRKIICVETGVVYPSAKAVSEEFGILPRTVHSSCQHGAPQNYQLQQIAGKPVFHFRYYNPEEHRPQERMWKPCVGFEGRYEVSNLGEVRHAQTHWIRTPYRQGPNGKTLILSMRANSGKMMYMAVARLVAEAFIPRVYGADKICHRDGNPDNNCVTNLYWSDHIGIFCNPMEKYEYMKGRPKRAVICEETGKLYDSIKEAADACKLHPTTVHMSCQARGKHRNKSINGKQILHFRYVDQ